MTSFVKLADLLYAKCEQLFVIMIYILYNTVLYYCGEDGEDDEVLKSVALLVAFGL